MNSDDRIWLAEAMGWKKRPRELLPEAPSGEPRFGPDRWDAPDGSNYGVAEGGLPSPLTDANDTEQVIRWLNSKGYEVTCMHWPEGDVTIILKRSIEIYGPRAYHDETTVATAGEGVVELALKIIEVGDGTA